MAMVDGHRWRAQITSAALVLVVVAATAGIGQGRAAGASMAAPPSVPSGEAGQAPVTFSDDVVRGLLSFQESDPVKPAPKAPERTSTGKVVYLTFDDGPSARYTRPILDLLDRHGAKATFFQLGENAVAHPGLSRSVVERGHILGSHTWNHRDMRRLSSRHMEHQLTRTSRALRRITGQPITCLRPPYGAVNRGVRSTVHRTDLALELWDVDPRDWKRPGAAAIAGRVVARVDPGDVVLMHDGGGNRSQSVRAPGRILRTLGKQGYTFAALPGCRT